VRVTDSVLSIKRPSNWGVVLVMDADTSDIPRELGRSGAGRSRTCLAFQVRHAQDHDIGHNPFEVCIDVRLGRPDRTVELEHRIEVPSGTVTIGDAEGEERVDISGSSCLVSVELDDAQHAEHVVVWLAPGRR
jgi:hypothetical protein